MYFFSSYGKSGFNYWNAALSGIAWTLTEPRKHIKGSMKVQSFSADINVQSCIKITLGVCVANSKVFWGI